MKQLEFFLLRYVPDAVKGEFINFGVVLLEPGGGGEIRLLKDWRRLLCADPDADLLPGEEEVDEEQTDEENEDQSGYDNEWDDASEDEEEEEPVVAKVSNKPPARTKR